MPYADLDLQNRFARHVMLIERERIAALGAQFDDFVYRDPEWAGGASVVKERESMERLAELVRGGE